MKENKFVLPPKGLFKSTNQEDPIDYYYKRIVGRIYRERVSQGLNLLSPPYNSILDFGYGSGILFPSLSKLGNTLAGIDVNAEPLDVKARLENIGLHVSLYQDDIINRYFEKESFDLIVAFSVFEHILHPQDILMELHRVLKPKGCLLVGMPRVDNIMDNLFRLIGYANIKNIHVTNYRQFLKQSVPFFNLMKISHFPSSLPVSAGLYFNMLFQKREDIGERIEK